LLFDLEHFRAREEAKTVLFRGCSISVGCPRATRV